VKWNKIKIHYLLRLSIFWFLFFALFRLLFIAYHHAKIPDGHHSETSLSFLYALKLDLATVCLMIFIPFVLWALQQFYKSRLLHQLNMIFNLMLITIVSIFSIFNLKIYGEYGELLNSEDLVYLVYPKEAITFLSIWSLLLLLGASAFFAYIGIRSYRLHITSFSLPYDNPKIKIAQLIFFPVFLFLGVSGGLHAIPIKEKNVQYSNWKINNDIATNNIWYLGYSICHRNDIPFKNENLHVQ
jgi:hypothetical protein